MKKHKKYVIGLIVITILHVIRMVYGIQTDEQYAMVLGQKIAGGSKLLKDCFEIHQTSGVFIGLLLKVKYLFTHSNTCDMLYLKSIGLIIQILVSIIIYKKLLKNGYEQSNSTRVALLFMLVTPKLSLMPDYSLQQYWLLSLITVYLFLYTNNKNRDTKYVIVLGVLNSMLTIAYPPFCIISISIIFILKRDAVKYFLAYISWILCFLILFINKNIVYTKNILNGSMHNSNILDKLYNYVIYDKLQIIYLAIIIILFIVAIKTKEKHEKLFKSINIVMMSSVIIIQFIVVYILKYSITFNTCYITLLSLIIMNKDGKIYNKSFILCSLASLIQLFVGNQYMFVCARYMFPVIICGMLIVSNKRENRILFFIMFACFAMQMTLPTSNFYNFEIGLHKIDDGSLKGVYANKELVSKIEYIEYIDSILDDNDKYKTILIMDSNLAMYNYIGLEINCPDTINTPVFNKKLSIYYQNNEKPNIISLLNTPGNIDVDDLFNAYLLSYYDQYKTNNGLIFILKEGDN